MFIDRWIIGPVSFMLLSFIKGFTILLIFPTVFEKQSLLVGLVA